MPDDSDYYALSRKYDDLKQKYDRLLVIVNELSSISAQHTVALTSFMGLVTTLKEIEAAIPVFRSAYSKLEAFDRTY